MALPPLLRWTRVDALRLPVRIPFGLRVFFRGAFLLLALATLGLALNVLQEEKQLSLRAYREGFAKTQGQITARLRHPTGQLALLNPSARSGPVTPLRPLVLPFGAIDFDDKAKAQQAVEMAGCLVQYGDDANLCVAVGNNPLAGGFVYAVGSLTSGDLTPRRLGDSDMARAHRLRVAVTMRGQTWRWLAPFEATGEPGPAQHGRLTGFADTGDGRTSTRPVRDFRGWLWQDARCQDGNAAEGCARRSFYSLRLPVELFREELVAQRSKLIWPPPDLDRIAVHLQVLAPGDAVLFDSNQAGAAPPFSLADLTPLLLPGETLRIRKAGAPPGAEIATLTGAEDTSTAPPALLDRLIRRLPVEAADSQALQAHDTIATPLGRYELQLSGDLRSVNRALARVAGRMVWLVGALLAAIALTWAAIELRMMRRITLLTKRAAAVSGSLQDQSREIALDVGELRGRDELGLLASTLVKLMERLNDNVRREHIRAAQEKDQWHAVGHEIMSPLQSLMVLHPSPSDASHRYVQRMQQAVRVLYGQASPTEAFEATTLPVNRLDLNEFLQHVASNAPHAGIDGVAYAAQAEALPVQADEYALEDVVTHVLRNASRYRTLGSDITLTVAAEPSHVTLSIFNQGPPIAADQLERIFEYGVSNAEGPGSNAGQRGQGLFVARTYMAKMGGTITAHNAAGGVRFDLRLRRG